jgi:hypothetical protein
MDICFTAVTKMGAALLAASCVFGSPVHGKNGIVHQLAHTQVAQGLFRLHGFGGHQDLQRGIFKKAVGHGQLACTSFGPYLQRLLQAADNFRIR